MLAQLRVRVHVCSMLASVIPAGLKEACCVGVSHAWLAPRLVQTALLTARSSARIAVLAIFSSETPVGCVLSRSTYLTASVLWMQWHMMAVLALCDSSLTVSVC